MQLFLPPLRHWSGFASGYNLAAQNALEVVFHFVIAVPVLHILHDVRHHLAYLVVRAAVTEALQGTDSCGDGGVDIRLRGGKHTRGKCGVVTAAVLCVEHHAKVEQLGFLVRELAILAQGIQNRLRRFVLRLERVEKHGLFIVMAALDLIGIRHDGRHTRNERDALAHVIFEREIVRVVIVGIERQNGSRMN